MGERTCLYLLPLTMAMAKKNLFSHTHTPSHTRMRYANKKIKSHKTRDTQQGEGRPSPREVD